MRVASAFIVSAIALAHVMAEPPQPATVQWDRATLTYLGEGAYARMARLPDGAVLLSYESHGKCFVKRSADDGRTWGEPVLVAQCKYGTASNPQPLMLADGTLWLLYNERPTDKIHPFAIRLTTSKDGGRTWTARAEPLYVAGVKFGDGCWEPAAVQLKSGEIQLFFANEGPYRTSDEQEITVMRSHDAGKTWSAPAAVSFRAGHRDGMPVPVELFDGSVAFAIEDNGLLPDHQMKPTIVHSDAHAEWPRLPLAPASPQRWGAVDATLRSGVYAGAPYLCQLANGKTVLSCQSDEDQHGPQMVVYVGDADARHFGGKSHPFRSTPASGGCGTRCS